MSMSLTFERPRVEKGKDPPAWTPTAAQGLRAIQITTASGTLAEPINHSFGPGDLIQCPMRRPRFEAPLLQPDVISFPESRAAEHWESGSTEIHDIQRLPSQPPGPLAPAVTIIHRHRFIRTLHKHRTSADKYVTKRHPA